MIPGRIASEGIATLVPLAAHQEQIPATMSQENTTLQTEQKALQANKTTMLSDMIAEFGSISSAKGRLQSLLENLARATDGQLACIYEYQHELECLQLTECSEQFLVHETKITVRPGEGFIGWTAMTREKLVLSKNATDDPRYQAVSMLDTSQLQAVVILPLETPEHQLLGVLSIQFNNPCPFTRQQDSLMQAATTLISTTIEQAQLQKSLQRQQSIQAVLASVGQIKSTGKSLPEILHSLANQTLQIMQADLCTIVLQDPENGQPTLQAISPQFNNFNVMTAPLESNGSHTALHSLTTEREGQTKLGPSGKVSLQTLLSLPLIVGTEILGQVNCYTCDTGRYGPTEQNLLSIIANQLALILKNSQYQLILSQKNQVLDFFEGLQTIRPEFERELQQRAEYLGCHLDKPYAVAMIEMSHNPQATQPAWNNPVEETPELEIQRLGSLLQRRIQSNYPGSLIHSRENTLTCLLHLSKDPTASRLRPWLRELAQEMKIEYNLILSIGIGNICQKRNDYPNGFAEASEALLLGSKFHPENRITHFNDLGVYRYLYKITRMDGLRDIYQDQIKHIAAYDERKGTDLLNTLAIYLEFAGNLTKTSNSLFVHRNTLIQRLDRLQSLCEVDLQDRSNWLTLQIAIKIYKLRATISNE